jgi:YcxB-like protein
VQEQQTITLNYALTFADFREGIPMSETKVVPLWRRLVGIFSWLFFLVILLFWWFASSLQPTPLAGMQTIEPRPGVDDLWLVLLPTLMPVLVIGLLAISTMVKGFMATDGVAPAVIKKRNAIVARVNLVLVVIIMFFGVRLLMNPQYGWAWTPSRPKVVIVAVWPWVILCVLILALLPMLRWLKARTLWNTTPPLRRPNCVEFNREGLVTVEAKSSSRFRWSYFTQYSETQNLLRLHMEDQRIFLIPKRAVGEQQMLELRSLICSNIAEGKFLVTDPRFAVMAPQPVIPILDEEAQPSAPPPN